MPENQTPQNIRSQLDNSRTHIKECVLRIRPRKCVIESSTITNKSKEMKYTDISIFLNLNFKF